MAVNRYTQISPSQFNPLSMDEIMLVPQLKRQQHNATLAQQEKIAQELAKVDPLKVHEDEAIRLREEMNNKLATQAEQLNKYGVDPSTQANMLALNREYQNLTGPTGKIGKINKAKQLYDAEKLRFLEQASKQYGSDRAIQLWEEKTKDYSGYSNIDPNSIEFINPQGIVAAQDFQDDLKTFNSLLGSTMREVARGGGNVVFDPELNGYKTTNSNSSETVKNNIDQLNEMRNVLKSKWIDETGEGAIYNKEAGIDINNFNNRFNSAINLQAESGYSKKSDFSVGFSGSGKGSEEEPLNIEGIPYETKEVGTKTEDYDELDRIGNLYNEGLPEAHMMGEGAAARMGNPKNDKEGKVFKYEDINNPILKERYKLMYDELVKNNTLKPEFQDPNNPQTAKYIKKRLVEQGPITLTSKVIKSDTGTSTLGFPGLSETKDANKRSANIKADITHNTRQIVDPETNRPISGKEFFEKYPDAEVDYYGYFSPHNVSNEAQWGNESQQSIIPHRITVTHGSGDDKKTFTTSMSRTYNDFNTSDFRASKTLNNVFRKITLMPNTYQKLESNVPTLKDAEVLYSTKNEYNTPMFTIKFANGRESRPLQEKEYMQFIYEQQSKYDNNIK